MLLPIIAWDWVYIYWQLNKTFPANLEGQELILTGYIADLPVITETSGLRFVLDVTSAYIKTTLTPFTGRVRLTWFKNSPVLKAGEQWQIVAKLKARHSAFNPGGFDYETNLFRNGIIATGYVHKPKTARRLVPATFSILSWREKLRDLLTNQLPPNAGTGMVIALTLGDVSGIGTRQWKALNNFGINHLVNVSGLHLTLIAGLVFSLVKILWQLSANLCLRLATAQAAKIYGNF